MSFFKKKLLASRCLFLHNHFVKPVDTEDIINITTRAGCLVLENGGETYRAEDTIVYVARSMGARSPSAFVTPTVVMFSFMDEELKHHSFLKRITTRQVNLRKIAQVNALSRRLILRGKKSDPRQVEHLLQRIDNAPGYPRALLVLAAAASSFFFAFMFGGGLREALAAFVIGGVLRIFLLALSKLPLNSFMTSLFSGALISFFSDLFVFSSLVPQSMVLMTAVLMQVVPGLAIVNAIRDIISGDLVSGTARTVEAFMIAAGLSAGSVFGLLIFDRMLVFL